MNTATFRTQTGAHDYHERERVKALASPENGWNRPVLRRTDTAILDIGCGAGQSFIAWDEHWQWAVATPTPLCVGMDVDEQAIREGMERAPWVRFLLQSGERIPYPADTFDLVMSRVSLNYCPIPKTLREIHRALKPGGRIWFTLHTRDHSENCMRRALYSLPRKLGVRFNGWLLKHFGAVVPIKGRYESWQDPAAFIRLLDRHGFSARFDISKDEADNDVLRVTGTKR